MARIDWIPIKNEYINTNISYRKLAEKHNISFSTLEKKARKDGWKKLKDEQCDKIDEEVRQKTADIIVEAQTDRLTQLLILADTAQAKIQEAFEQLTTYMDDYGRVTESDIIDVNRLRKLLASLKDLKDVLAVDSGTSADEKKQSELLNAIEKAVRDAD